MDLQRAFLSSFQIWSRSFLFAACKHQRHHPGGAKKGHHQKAHNHVMECLRF